MQFKVPQFIDVEDKVIGPLTFKQFAYLAGGGGLVYLAFRLLPTLVAFPVAAAFAALALALAFFKYNEKPFSYLLESFVRFHLRSRLYLWHKQPHIKEKEPAEKVEKRSFFDRSALTESKLKTLSWSLDVIDPKSSE
ncbi:MAG TPA: PrgI family protein [Candidatus Paceibacterota bacterium]|jgi:hypothetical protein|nr:PrgI family protein [Candidatus Paceibacterota bacterium]